MDKYQTFSANFLGKGVPSDEDGWEAKKTGKCNPSVEGDRAYRGVDEFWWHA